MILQAKTLIVDDDLRFGAYLKQFLVNNNFSVDYVGDAEQMNKKLALHFYDLIILDWMMPGEDGLSVCKRLHTQKNSPPIIMLTANGTEKDSIDGLINGADDYLAKPFRGQVLLARIQVVLRRRPRVLASVPDSDEAFYFGPYQLNFAQRCCFLDDKRIDLTSNEFALLNILAKNKGTPVSRERLSFHIKGKENKLDCRFIDMHIFRLRQLLEKDPSHPVYLQTVRGLGYLLNQQTTIN